jgi:predicted metalloprotease
MRWKGQDESGNIEDRRGMSPRGLAIGGGGLGIVITIVYLLLGGDPSALKNAPNLGGGTTKSGEYQETAQEAERRHFVAVVLAETEKVWTAEFRAHGSEYAAPKLVLFSGSVDSACGMASAATGPFYCGEDRKVYIDLAFYDVLRDRFGAGGDFAQAYVIAHEVGHHVQNLLGTLEKIHQQQAQVSEAAYNRLSVRLELQADYYAGVWANHAKQMASLDEQDIREAIDAASAIGDDAIQKQAQGYVVPDSFTHGTSEQRVRWFLKGWKSGDLSGGDTFSAKSL